MKTTLVIPDPVMRRVKEHAAREGTTISWVVEAALRRFFTECDKPPPDLPPLPTWDLGTPAVDISNREALYDFFDRNPD